MSSRMGLRGLIPAWNYHQASAVMSKIASIPHGRSNMRKLLFTALALSVLGLSAPVANAQETGDGCSNRGWCEPGARPGVPRYYSDVGRYPNYDRGRGHHRGYYMHSYRGSGCGVDRHGRWRCWR